MDLVTRHIGRLELVDGVVLEDNRIGALISCRTAKGLLDAASWKLCVCCLKKTHMLGKGPSLCQSATIVELDIPSMKGEQRAIKAALRVEIERSESIAV